MGQNSMIEKISNDEDFLSRVDQSNKRIKMNLPKMTQSKYKSIFDTSVNELELELDKINKELENLKSKQLNLICRKIAIEEKLKKNGTRDK